MSAPESRGPDRGLGESLRRAADAATPRTIDVDRVLAASRGRRRSRRTAVLGATAVVAVLLAAGGLATAVSVLGPNSASDSADSALTSETAAESGPQTGSEEAAGDASGLRLAAPEKVNLCGAPVAPETDSAGSGLIVTVEPPAALAPGATGDARVTVTNAGPEPVVGDLRVAPALTVAGDGITRWHTNGVVADALVPVNLEPGASAELAGPVAAVACSDADELAEAFPPGLPALVPGEYAVTAVVMFIDHETGAIEYLVSPLAPLPVQ